MLHEKTVRYCYFFLIGKWVKGLVRPAAALAARTRPLDAFGDLLALSSWCMQGEAAVMLPRIKHGCLRGSPEGAEPLLGQLKRSERRQIN